MPSWAIQAIWFPVELIPGLAICAGARRGAFSLFKRGRRPASPDDVQCERDPRAAGGEHREQKASGATRPHLRNLRHLCSTGLFSSSCHARGGSRRRGGTKITQLCADEFAAFSSLCALPRSAISVVEPATPSALPAPERRRCPCRESIAVDPPAEFTFTPHSIRGGAPVASSLRSAAACGPPSRDPRPKAVLPAAPSPIELLASRASYSARTPRQSDASHTSAAPPRIPLTRGPALH